MKANKKAKAGKAAHGPCQNVLVVGEARFGCLDRRGQGHEADGSGCLFIVNAVIPKAATA